MKDYLTPKAVVAALDEHIIGQDDAKRAVAVALRNRWRRQQLAPRAARRGDAQEHIDDRPDRLRQDRDQPAPRQARRRALRQGRGDQVHRGRLCRPRRRADRPRPGRGSGAAREGAPPRGGARGRQRRGDGAPARRAHRQGCEPGHPRELPAARRRQPYERQGGRDRGDRPADDAVRDSRHGRPGRHDQPLRHDGQGDRPAAQEEAQDARRRGLGQIGRGGIGQEARSPTTSTAPP